MRRQIGDGGAEDAAVIGLQNRGEAIGRPRHRGLDRVGRAVGAADYGKAADDIGMGQGAALVFTPLDRVDTAAIERDQ